MVYLSSQHLENIVDNFFLKKTLFHSLAFFFFKLSVTVILWVIVGQKDKDLVKVDTFKHIFS